MTLEMEPFKLIKDNFCRSELGGLFLVNTAEDLLYHEDENKEKQTGGNGRCLRKIEGAKSETTQVNR